MIAADLVLILTKSTPLEYYIQGVFFMKRLRWGRAGSGKGTAIFKTIVFVFIAFFIFVFFFFESRVSPFMSDYTVMKGQQMMTELFSDKVNEKLDEMNLTYDKLMNISYSKNGEVQSLNTDVIAVNKLKNEVTCELSEILNEEYEYVVEIPVGSIFDSEFLSGLGWNLEFNNVVTGGETVLVGGVPQIMNVD